MDYSRSSLSKGKSSDHQNFVKSNSGSSQQKSDNKDKEKISENNDIRRSFHSDLALAKELLEITQNRLFLLKYRLLVSSSRMSEGRSSRRNFIEQRLSKRDSQVLNETTEMIVPLPNAKPKRQRRIMRKRKKKKNSQIIKNKKPKISMTSYDIGLTNEEAPSSERDK